jgi:hypothetical protein
VNYDNVEEVFEAPNAANSKLWSVLFQYWCIFDTGVSY